MPQILLNGVRDVVFSFYDGSQWRTSWDSTTENPQLPSGIKVEIQLEPDAEDPNAPLPPLLQLVVPVMVSAPTNSTTQASSGGQQ